MPSNSSRKLGAPCRLTEARSALSFDCMGSTVSVSASAIEVARAAKSSGLLLFTNADRGLDNTMIAEEAGLIGRILSSRS